MAVHGQAGEMDVRSRTLPTLAASGLLLVLTGCGGSQIVGIDEQPGDSSASPATASPTPPKTPDPETSAPPDSGWPDWLYASDLHWGATITVVRDGDLDQVKEAFGAVGDPVRPWDPSISTADEYNEVDPWAAFAAVPHGVVVVEPNGFTAVNPTVVERASSDALAVVVYWNVELDTAVMVGESGEVVGDIYYPDVGDGRLQELVPDGVPTQPDAVEAVAWGLRTQPELTGIELTPELRDQMSNDASAYRLEPPDWP